MSDIKKFTIDRGIWLYGEGEESRLLRSGDHKMCCLGIFSEACGVEYRELMNRSFPTELETEDLDKLPKWLWKENVVGKITEANDAPWPNHKIREELIADLFKENGVEVVFEGEYDDECPPAPEGRFPEIW